MSEPGLLARRQPDDPAPLASRAIVGLIGCIAFINVYAMQSVLPLLMADFDASPVQAGLTVGATILAVALLSPFMGLLSDAWGRKGLICASLFALVLPTLLIPLAASLNQVIALRFLQGLAVPGIVVVLMAYLAEEFQATGGVARMISTYVAGSVMGGFSGRFIAGHAAHWWGWQGAFLTLGLLTLGGGLLVLWRLPRSRHFVPSRDWRSALASLRSHLGNPRLLAACAVGFCVLFSLVGSFTYVNLHLAGAPFRLSAAGLANVFTVYLLGVLVTPLAGRLIQRWGFLRTLLGALLVSSGGLLLTLLPALAPVILGLAICSSAIFVCQAATISFIAGQVSQGRSLATGLYNMSYYSGGALAAWVAGLGYESQGWSGVVALMILAQLLAGSVAALSWQRAPGRSA